MEIFAWQFFVGLAVGAIGMGAAHFAFQWAVEWWLRQGCPPLRKKS